MESAVENCRAYGNALSLDLRRGNRANITNNSLTGQGDCLVIAQCAQEGNCEGNERVLLQNDLFIGQTDFTNTTETSCLSLLRRPYRGSFRDRLFVDLWCKRPQIVPDSHNTCGIDPRITSMDLANFSPQPLENSPLIDIARELKCPQTDFLGHRRPQGGGCDIGAIELLTDNLFFFPLIGN